MFSLKNSVTETIVKMGPTDYNLYTHIPAVAKIIRKRFFLGRGVRGTEFSALSF